jgi:4-azaleucine resistance transporter AzlC
VVKGSAFVARGIREALPAILGCIPIGMAHGLLTQQAGFAVWLPLALSLFVFAGASQFVAVSMLQNGAGPAVVIGTAFIVNFRHLLMSASLAPCLKSWTMRQRLLTGCLLTDESFALLSADFAGDGIEPTAAIALSVSIYIVWTLSVVTGFHMGSLIANPAAWGLDFALPAMFAGLLLPICTRRPAVVAGVCGGATSTLLHCLGFGAWGAFIGALVGATAGSFPGFPGLPERGGHVE